MNVTAFITNLLLVRYDAVSSSPVIEFCTVALRNCEIIKDKKIENKKLEKMNSTLHFGSKNSYN